MYELTAISCYFRLPGRRPSMDCIAMRFGRAACKAHFGNQQLCITHRYMGEVKGRATDDQGVTTVSVLWDGDSTEVETNEKHVYPLQPDGEPYEFDEEASIKEYEDEMAASSKPKAKKSKKGAPSSRTGAGGSSGTQASRAPSRPEDPKLPKFILPEVEWNEVPSFKNHSAPAPKSGPSWKPRAMPTRVRGMKVIICFMRSPIFGRNPPYELMRTSE